MQVFDYLRKLFNNPLGLFVYGILSKWYLMITVTAVIVTFWVFKGLEKAGVLTASYNVVTDALSQTKAVAKYCVPKIVNIKDFWDCVENPPNYESTVEEQKLESGLQKYLGKTPPNNGSATDPYD